MTINVYFTTRIGSIGADSLSVLKLGYPIFFLRYPIRARNSKIIGMDPVTSHGSNFGGNADQGQYDRLKAEFLEFRDNLSASYALLLANVQQLNEKRYDLYFFLTIVIVPGSVTVLANILAHLCLRCFDRCKCKWRSECWCHAGGIDKELIVIINTAMLDPVFASMINETYHYFCFATRQTLQLGETIVRMHTEAVTALMYQWDVGGHYELRYAPGPAPSKTRLANIGTEAMEERNLRKLLVTTHMLYKWCQIASFDNLAACIEIAREYTCDLNLLNAYIERAFRAHRQIMG
ncbi:uncharacterized protein LOC129587152 [Paramacrobiotus metropolitanus]|uniref:uncharacterized protein LOC129587152 n=1 Tax=Paramacrobiotus metropolitanus TaxID=2943436 RepID=UPI002446058F|nr:uncharacterized protein LOC129587152 [Paramacrobiotus metropolitanus]